jgi:hypothetical protein
MIEEYFLWIKNLSSSHRFLLFAYVLFQFNGTLNNYDKLILLCFKLNKFLWILCSGRAEEGCQSIVLAGGYEDDTDDGFEFIYTGSGGRDLSGNKRTAEQSSDQV